MLYINKIALFDTINHPTPILKEWGVGFADLGYNVDFFPIQHYNILACGDEYDLIVYAGDLNYETFYKFKNKSPNTIIVCAANELIDYAPYKGIIDFFINIHNSNLTLKQHVNKCGFELYQIPLAGNDHLFYPLIATEKYDVCFIGGLGHGYRHEDKYLYPLLDDPKLKCFLAGMTYGQYYNIPFIKYKESNEIRNQTKININFHYDFQKPNNITSRIDLNESVFNIALSGRFQICDHPLAAELFDNKIILADETNWLDVINYYLHHDEERKILEHKARKIAIEKHTWKVRMQEFITILCNHYD